MAKLAVKPGTQPPLVYLVVAVANVAMTYTDIDVVTLTAGLNGQHGAWSLHYSLRALDVRSKNFDPLARKQAFVADVQHELDAMLWPGACQALLEDVGTDNEHMHVEFDPPKGTPHAGPPPPPIV